METLVDPPPPPGGKAPPGEASMDATGVSNQMIDDIGNSKHQSAQEAVQFPG